MKQVIHGVLGPLQLIEKLQAYDETKIKDFERRIVGTVRPPTKKKS
jgi:hypothetical protein